MDNKKITNCVNKIPDYRLEFIDKRIDDFIYLFKDLEWPLDFVLILKRIESQQLLPINVISEYLHTALDAVTVYCHESKRFLLIINSNKINYPFKSSRDRRLNFTLAHELGHIFLNHHEIPDEYKSKEDLDLEELEADEFAGRILMPDFLLTESYYPSLDRLAPYFNVSTSALLKRLSTLKNRVL